MILLNNNSGRAYFFFSKSKNIRHKIMSLLRTQKFKGPQDLQNDYNKDPSNFIFLAWPQAKNNITSTYNKMWICPSEFVPSTIFSYLSLDINDKDGHMKWVGPSTLYGCSPRRLIMYANAGFAFLGQRVNLCCDNKKCYNFEHFCYNDIMGEIFDKISELENSTIPIPIPIPISIEEDTRVEKIRGLWANDTMEVEMDALSVITESEIRGLRANCILADDFAGTEKEYKEFCAAKNEGFLGDNKHEPNIKNIYESLDITMENKEMIDENKDPKGIPQVATELSVAQDNEIVAKSAEDDLKVEDPDKESALASIERNLKDN